MSFSSLFNQTTLPQHTCRIRPALWLFSFAFVSPPDDLPFANKMSYCKEEGKDKIIFMSTEDLSKPSSVSFPEDEPAPGLILASGEINWNCPCLGGMATGPCGVEFREAFSCFHYSKEEPKGSECFGVFKTMQECMSQYPTIYGNKDNQEEETQPSGHQEQSKTIEHNQSTEAPRIAP